MPTTQAIPPPYAGQNDRLPIIAVQNPQCQYMHNFNNLDGVVKVRQGNEKFCEIAGPGQPLNIASYGTKLFAVFDPVGATPLTWYDITTGTPSSVHTGPGTGGDDEINTLYYNDYLLYFGEFSISATPIYYSGSAWGNVTWTWPANFNPFGGDVFKNRAYIIGRGTSKYAYTPIDLAATPSTVAVTEVDLGSVISETGYLYIIRPISLTQNLTAEAVQAFIFSTGEILVYSGSYPDSANWSLASRFTIPSIPYMHFYIDAKGDSFIMTESEILSLRNLYVSGYDYERQNGIGAAIKNRWTAIIKALGSGGVTLVHGTYDKSNDRLIISFPGWLDPETSVLHEYPSQLIYDFTLMAWYEQYQVTEEGYITYSVTYFDSYTYLWGYERDATSGVCLKLEGKDNFVDEDPATGAEVAIPFKLLTAPLPLQKFGANAVSGVEAICRSDMYPQVNYKFIADLGRQETEAQTILDQGQEMAKPMMNVGIQGATTVQLQIAGESTDCTLGFELYALNIWYNPGAEGSR